MNKKYSKAYTKILNTLQTYNKMKTQNFFPHPNLTITLILPTKQKYLIKNNLILSNSPLYKKSPHLIKANMYSEKKEKNPNLTSTSDPSISTGYPKLLFI